MEFATMIQTIFDCAKDSTNQKMRMYTNKNMIHFVIREKNIKIQHHYHYFSSNLGFIYIKNI